MLQNMRHLAQSWLFKGLMLILVISFGIWGIGDIFRGNPLKRAVARVGGQTITVQDLNREFEEALTKMRQTLGPDLTAQQAKQFGLLDKALDSMIERVDVDLEMKRFGIDVTDKAVLDWLEAQPELHNKDGSFNKELFHRILEKSHLGEAGFIDQERKAMAQHELFYAVRNSGKVPKAVVNPVTIARGQKRILDVVTLANDSMGDIPVPGEKTLRDFYQKNQQSFIAPEYRSLTIARLSTDDLAKGISIDNDQLKKEYDVRIAQFAHPERRDILQVVMQDEDKAKQLAVDARSGGNLPNAASDMGYKSVPLNQTEEKTLLPELAKAVFALKSGQISDPVKSPLGWHVLQLKKITPAGTSGFDDVKEQLRDTMQRDQAVDASARLANQLDDELAAGHALEDIADSMKLRLIKIPAIDAGGKTPEGKEPSELPDKADVLKAGFAQNAGEPSPVIDDRNGNYLIVRTDEVTLSAARPFEKVKDQIAAAWKTQMQTERAAAEAEKIAKALRNGAAPSSFAAQDGVDVRVSKPISLLGDNDTALPSSILPQVLKMKKGEVITSTVPGHQIILRLARLIDMDADANGSARTNVADEIGRQIPDELTEEYLKHLQTLFPARIDQDVLETIRQQGG